MPFKPEHFGKRAEDEGKESPIIKLARIDENVQFLKAGAESTRIQLHEHQKDDIEKFDDIKDKFDDINKSIWMVSGGVCVIVFILNWIHK